MPSPASTRVRCLWLSWPQVVQSARIGSLCRERLDGLADLDKPNTYGIEDQAVGQVAVRDMPADRRDSVDIVEALEVSAAHRPIASARAAVRFFCHFTSRHGPHSLGRARTPLTLRGYLYTGPASPPGSDSEFAGSAATIVGPLRLLGRLGQSLVPDSRLGHRLRRAQ